MKKRLVGVQELAEMLGIPKGTIYNWKSQQRIPFVKLGGRTMFDLDRIDKWLAEQSFEPIKDKNAM